MSKTISTARKVRRDQTQAEKKVWEKIRNRQRGVKFRRQVPVGPYIADFLCLELKMIIEVDGGQHAESERDLQRSEYLEGLGFVVVRLWNNDVLSNPEGAAEEIARCIATRRR